MEESVVFELKYASAPRAFASFVCARLLVTLLSCQRAQ
jgi:hypothetical protein